MQTFGGVDRLSVTLLVDNKTDLLVTPTDTIKYANDKPLLAEHGFSALLRLGDSGSTILLDAGASRLVLSENVRQMEIDPAAIATVVLSHGHPDHYEGLTDFLETMALHPERKKWREGVTEAGLESWLDSYRLPIVAHPAAFRERWQEKGDGTMFGPFESPPVKAWEAHGAKLVLSEGPYQLGPGCWTTGYIPRNSFENKTDVPNRARYRQGEAFLPDDQEEDMAIVVNVKGKGLVVISGCAHAGIINTVEYAREISGVGRVWAIIGGFHLGVSSDEVIERTVDYFERLSPELVVPCHCTGFRAQTQVADRLPDAFSEGVVGATYLI